MHRGRLIDRDEATELARSGFDLSLLDPRASDVWHPHAAGDESPSLCPSGATPSAVEYESALPSAGGLYRSRVFLPSVNSKAPAQLLMSLQSHAAIIRAQVLRKLGYQIAAPSYCPTLTLQFKSPQDKIRFFDELSDETLTHRARWVSAINTDEAERLANDPNTSVITLQDVLLEPAQIETPMYHWGMIPSTHLKGRRALRALLLPLVLLEIPEAINLYSWELGKIFSDAVLLTHPFAENFSETTFPDLRWAARRLATWTRADWEELIVAGHYPPDVTRLLTEKVIARRNHLVELFRLEAPKLTYDPKLSLDHVRNGKLTRETYPGYAGRFTYGNPLAPLRAGEVFKYLALSWRSFLFCGL